MKKLIISLIISSGLIFILSQNLMASETRYEMRVDGLACPFCAFGIEKKLKAIEGSSAIDVDLDKGIVHVNMAEGKTLNEQQMIKLFNDSGFTYRSMKKSIVK